MRAASCGMRIRVRGPVHAHVYARALTADRRAADRRAWPIRAAGDSGPGAGRAGTPRNCWGRYSGAPRPCAAGVRASGTGDRGGRAGRGSGRGLRDRRAAAGVGPVRNSDRVDQGDEGTGTPPPPSCTCWPRRVSVWTWTTPWVRRVAFGLYTPTSCTGWKAATRGWMRPGRGPARGSRPAVEGNRPVPVGPAGHRPAADPAPPTVRAGRPWSAGPSRRCSTPTSPSTITSPPRRHSRRRGWASVGQVDADRSRPGPTAPASPRTICVAAALGTPAEPDVDRDDASWC